MVDKLVNGKSTAVRQPIYKSLGTKGKVVTKKHGVEEAKASEIPPPVDVDEVKRAKNAAKNAKKKARKQAKAAEFKDVEGVEKQQKSGKRPAVDTPESLGAVCRKLAKLAVAGVEDEGILGDEDLYVQRPDGFDDAYVTDDDDKSGETGSKEKKCVSTGNGQPHTRVEARPKGRKDHDDYEKHKAVVARWYDDARDHLGHRDIHPKGYRDVKAWALSRFHRLPSSNEAAIKVLKGMGLKVDVDDSMSRRDHPISKICRDECVVEILTKEGRDRNGVVILDWYGSDRNRKFETDIERDGLAVRFWNCPGDVVRGDAGRSGSRRPMPDPYTCDVALIQDVYYGGSCVDTSLSPRTISYVAEHTRQKKVYVMFRPFVGAAGTDSSYEGCGVEGVWYRDDKGMVVFSPEEGGVLYPPHPDVNWLLKRSCDGAYPMDIQDIRTIGPYKLVCCMVRPSGARGAVDPGLSFPLIVPYNPPARVFDAISDFTSKKVSTMLDRVVPKGIRRFAHVHRPSDLLEHTGIRNQLLNVSYRPSNGYLMDSAMIAVKREMEKDSTMSALGRRFAPVYARILEGTLLAVLYSDRVARVKRAMGERDFNRESETILRSVRDPMVLDFTPPQPMSLWYYAAFAGLLCCNKWTWPITKVVCKQGIGFVLANIVPAKMSVQEARFGYNLGEYPISFAPVAAGVLVEEGFRSISPLCGVLLGTYEFGVRWYRYGWSNRWLPPLIGHLALTYLRHSREWSFLSCTAIHMLWNFYCHVGTKAIHGFLWRSFKDLHSKGSFIIANGSYHIPIPAGEFLTPLQNKVKEWKAEIRGKMDIEVNGVAMTPTEALQALDGEKEGSNVMWPVLITHRLLFQPAKTAKNLLLALLSRIHKIPKYHVKDTSIRRKAWAQTYGLLDRSGLLDTPVFQNTSFKEAMQGMGSRGKRLVLANTREIEEGAGRYVKSQSLKWNETITAHKSVAGEITIKPRAITQLDPKGLANCSPWSKDLAETEKKHIFRRNPVLLPNGITVYLVYASGLDQDQLDEIAEFAASCEDVVIVVSGDDSFITFGKLSDYFGAVGAEGDLSMADQSQDDACFDEYQFKVMKRLGIPKEIIEMLRDQSRAPYSVDKDGLRVRGDPGCQLPTGSTVTSVCNTNTVLGGFLFYLSKCNLQQKPPVPEEVFAELGLELKFVYLERFSLITFLKGWFKQDVQGAWHWMPLPSQVIKIGKCLRDPVHLMSVTRRGRTVRFSPTESVRQYATLIYKGHANIEREYPVLGEFLATLQRLGSEPKAAGDVVESEKFNRISFGKFPKLNQAMVDEDMEERYGITVQDCERVNALLKSVTSLPALLVDPVFDSLCDVDYPGDVTTLEPMSLFQALFGGGPIVKKTAYMRVKNEKELRSIPALVGVEENPGPRSKKGTRRATVVQVMVPKLSKKQSSRKKKKSRKSKKGGRGTRGLGKLSAAGVAYQKCTLAPADFSMTTDFQGIPDEYDGSTIAKQYRLVSALQTYTPGNDVYIVQLPTPGVAYWYGQRAGGSTATLTLTPVNYDDAATLFPPGSETNNVEAFRYASNVIELVPTVNEMSWGGSIQVWKSRVSETMAIDITEVGAVYPTIMCIEGVGTVNAAKASAIFPFKDGCYVPAFNTEANFPWTPVRANVPWADINANQLVAFSAGSNDHSVAFATTSTVNYLGMGTFEATVIKIPAAVAAQTAVIRSWACVEYQVNELSYLYDLAHMSPAHDPAALAMVKAFHKTLPAGVCWKDNATFWQEFVKWSKRITGVGKLLPGPVGTLMGGFNTLLTEGHGWW
jgi:hypothetical protein